MESWSDGVGEWGSGVVTVIEQWVLFPLTPALSLGERGARRPSVELTEALRKRLICIVYALIEPAELDSRGSFGNCYGPFTARACRERRFPLRRRRVLHWGR